MERGEGVSGIFLLVALVVVDAIFRIRRGSGDGGREVLEILVRVPPACRAGNGMRSAGVACLHRGSPPLQFLLLLLLLEKNFAWLLLRRPLVLDHCALDFLLGSQAASLKHELEGGEERDLALVANVELEEELQQQPLLDRDHQVLDLLERGRGRDAATIIRLQFVQPVLVRPRRGLDFFPKGDGKLVEELIV